MDWFMRVLGAEDPDLSANEIYDALRKDGLDADIYVVDDEIDPGKFAALNVFNWEHECLGQLTRNACATDDEPGFEELCTLEYAVMKSNPGATMDWLMAHFLKTTVIYKFQMEHPVIYAKNYAIVESMMKTIRNCTAGISHMDDDGFTNEAGDLILLQWPDNVHSEIVCAVLEDGKNWQRFTLNTADLQARQDFLDGKVPQNAARF